MTGPSLAGLGGREAGTAKGFTRYSPALKSSGIVWKEETLDRWLADPGAIIPGNYMTFPGIRDSKARADLIAFLRKAAGDGSGRLASRTGIQLRDLKTLGPGHQVTAIRYCGDTYRVTTAAGELAPFWEFNLRFKTDSGDTGPVAGHPAIMPAGMRGDRASVIFADPSEISAFVRKTC